MRAAVLRSERKAEDTFGVLFPLLFAALEGEESLLLGGVLGAARARRERLRGRAARRAAGRLLVDGVDPLAHLLVVLRLEQVDAAVVQPKGEKDDSNCEIGKAVEASFSLES